MRRKGLIRLSGNASRAAFAESGEIEALTELTTLPRLMAVPPARAMMEYQLISASAAPWSFMAIQVPPPGSDGEITARPFTFFLFGGSPVGRVSFSSRFIP